MTVPRLRTSVIGARGGWTFVLLYSLWREYYRSPYTYLTHKEASAAAQVRKREIMKEARDG